MRRALLLILSISFMAGCQSCDSFGQFVGGAVYSALFEDDDDRRRESSDREAWRSATGGAWDGVHVPVND